MENGLIEWMDVGRMMVDEKRAMLDGGCWILD